MTTAEQTAYGQVAKEAACFDLHITGDEMGFANPHSVIALSTVHDRFGGINREIVSPWFRSPSSLLLWWNANALLLEVWSESAMARDLSFKEFLEKIEETTKWCVAGPDQLVTQPDPLDTILEAGIEREEFCARFRKQGYYSSVGGRITLDKLPKQCRIEPILDGEDVADAVERKLV